MRYSHKSCKRHFVNDIFYFDSIIITSTDGRSPHMEKTYVQQRTSYDRYYNNDNELTTKLPIIMHSR